MQKGNASLQLLPKSTSSILGWFIVCLGIPQMQGTSSWLWSFNLLLLRLLGEISLSLFTELLVFSFGDGPASACRLPEGIFWEVWGLLPAFSRCSVGVVPHVGIVLMYLWEGRWSPRLTPLPSWWHPLLTVCAVSSEVPSWGPNSARNDGSCAPEQSLLSLSATEVNFRYRLRMQRLAFYM